jgi:hypothetical protein
MVAKRRVFAVVRSRDRAVGERSFGHTVETYAVGGQAEGILRALPQV